MKWLLVFLFVCTGIEAEESNFTFTYEMATRCKEHESQRGYSYDTFYSIKKDLHKTTRSSEGLTVTLEMHIAIQASSNGHILLSPEPYPDKDTPVYEIAPSSLSAGNREWCVRRAHTKTPSVANAAQLWMSRDSTQASPNTLTSHNLSKSAFALVGGGGNHFTEIRRNLRRNSKASIRTDNILSSVSLRGFFIKIYLNGLVAFGKEGSSEALVSFYDTDPLNIEYFSFAAWNGVEAKFLYDCPPPGESKGSNESYVHNSTRMERNLSASDQLRKDKLQDRPPQMAPLPEVNVSVKVKLTNVIYNAFDAKLTTRMTILTMWKDESLAWNPDKFNGLVNVTYRQGQIWRPVLHIVNSDSIKALKTTGYERIMVNSTGDALFHFKSTVDTWCYVENNGYNRWPRDSYTCFIYIQPWETHEKIIFSVNKNSLGYNFADVDDLVENEWQLVGGAPMSVITSDLKKLNLKGLYVENFSAVQNNSLMITLTVQRKPTNYNIVFYTPLLVLMTFVLMSFWGEPLQMSRVLFYAGATVFICAGLCFIDYLIPCHNVPSILVLYIVVLGSILAALILQVMMMTSVTDKMCKTPQMQNILSASWFRAVFCLPEFKVIKDYNRINDGFLQEEEEAASAMPPNGNVEEMRAEASRYCGKEALAEAIDRTMFVIYSILFAAMLAAHY